LRRRFCLMAFCLAIEGSYWGRCLAWSGWRGDCSGGSGGAGPTVTVIASVAKQSVSPSKGRMDCFVARAPRNDGNPPNTASRSRGSICPRLGIVFPYPPNRGRRECRVHAAPAVSCAIGVKKYAHEHTGSAEASDIPCAMVLRLISCSPRSGRARCHRRRRNGFHQLDASIGASGPHDFTVRFRTVRQRHIRVHRIPSRACDDRETPLVPGRDEIDILLIWVRRQVNFGKSEIEAIQSRALRQVRIAKPGGATTRSPGFK
jgi:hypothetical protein